MTWVDQLKNSLPDSVSDVKLSLDLIQHSQLQPEEAEAVALAAAYAQGNTRFVKWLDSMIANRQEAQAAISAASLTIMDNVYSPFIATSMQLRPLYDAESLESLNSVPRKLSMSAVLTHGGTTQARFELYCLAASAVTKFGYCIQRLYTPLQDQGYTVEQLRDAAQIAAVIASVSKIWDN